MSFRESRTWRALQVALTLVVVAFAARYLWSQWTSAAAEGFTFEFHPAWMLLASALVLVTYGILVETWRRIVAQLGTRIGFWPAARIWLISNLGKYVPGKIWQVTTMAMMLGQHGVSLASAGASAAVITIANVATGFALVLILSVGTVKRIAGGTAGVIAATVAMLLVLVAAPLLARQWNRLAERTGRERLAVSIPHSAIAISLAGCVSSWVLYGLAFQWFVRSLIGPGSASLAAYITANAASYLVGYLMIFAPAGLGFREIALVSILRPLGIATAPQAAVITVGSRLWLTVLEMGPSLIALLTRRPHASPVRPDRGAA